MAPPARKHIPRTACIAAFPAAYEWDDYTHCLPPFPLEGWASSVAVRAAGPPVQRCHRYDPSERRKALRKVSSSFSPSVEAFLLSRHSMEIVAAKTSLSSHSKAGRLFITPAELLRILNGVFKATNTLKDGIRKFESWIASQSPLAWNPPNLEPQKDVKDSNAATL